MREREGHLWVAGGERGKWRGEDVVSGLVLRLTKQGGEGEGCVFARGAGQFEGRAGEGKRRLWFFLVFRFSPLPRAPILSACESGHAPSSSSPSAWLLSRNMMAVVSVSMSRTSSELKSAAYSAGGDGHARLFLLR